MNRPVMRPKLKLSNPELPPMFSEYEQIASKMPAWAVRKALMGDYPRHLYNYLRFDPDSKESRRNLSTMLLDSNLYLADPADFNDPFEFKNKLVLDDDDVLQRYFGAIFRETYPDLDKPTSAFNALLETLIDEVKSTSGQMFSALFETHSHGVHCFTPEPKSQLMWSHYADSHRGICLQFRTSYDVRTFLAAGPVDYCDDFPEFHFPTAPKEDTIAMMMRKGTAWAYEKERRIVMLAINSRLLPFRPQALTGLILGGRFPEKHLPAIKQMLNERIENGLPPIRLYQAETEKSAYRLTVRSEGNPKAVSGPVFGAIPWDAAFER